MRSYRWVINQLHFYGSRGGPTRFDLTLQRIAVECQQTFSSIKSNLFCFDLFSEGYTAVTIIILAKMSLAFVVCQMNISRFRL